MNYNCGICNYETCDLSHFNRHKKSKKHLKNLKKNALNETNLKHSCNIFATQKNVDECRESTNKNINETNENIFKCYHCKKNFKHHQSMYRHQKYYCKENKLIKIENDELKEQNKKLLNIVENNSHTIKKSVSTINYATKNFNNAPPIRLLEGNQLNGLLDYNDKKYTIEDMLIHQYEKKLLHQYLGDLIINEYKEDNPSDQSLWSSDVSRLTFVIKEKIGKSSKWILDKKGISLTEKIISPLTKRTKEILQEYIKSCDNKIKNLKDFNDTIESNTRKILEKMDKTNTIIMFINLKKLNLDILKYIAPYFNLDLKIN